MIGQRAEQGRSVTLPVAAKLWNAIHKKTSTSSNCLKTSINLIKFDNQSTISTSTGS